MRSAASAVALGAGAWVSTAAYAVNDVPGGPAVNQLNFAPPATKIAEEQHWLHWFMLILCAVIFVIVFATSGLAAVQPHRAGLAGPGEEGDEAVLAGGTITVGDERHAPARARG